MSIANSVRNSQLLADVLRRYQDAQPAPPAPRRTGQPSPGPTGTRVGNPLRNQLVQLPDAPSNNFQGFTHPPSGWARRIGQFTMPQGGAPMGQPPDQVSSPASLVQLPGNTAPAKRPVMAQPPSDGTKNAQLAARLYRRR